MCATIERVSPPSSAGGFPEPPPACGCGGYRFPLPLPFLLLHALPCSAPYRRMAELGRHSRGPPSPLGSGGRGPPSPLFPLPAPCGAERCPAIKAGLFFSADAKGAKLRAGRNAPAFGGLGAFFSLVVSSADGAADDTPVVRSPPSPPPAASSRWSSAPAF